MADLEDKQIQGMMLEGDFKGVEDKLRLDLSSLGSEAKFYNTKEKVYYYDPEYKFVSGKGGGVTKFQFSGKPGDWKYNFVYIGNNGKETVEVSDPFRSYGQAIKSITDYVSRKKLGSLSSYYKELINE